MNRVFLILFMMLQGVNESCGQSEQYTIAERNAIHAQNALGRTAAFLRKWTSRKDRSTSLLRQGDVWQVGLHAARLYPQLMIAAHLVNPSTLGGFLSETLRDEIGLTSRINSLPDDYAFDSRDFVKSRVDTNRIRLQASRYAVGLLATTRILGSGIWMDRLVDLTEDLFDIAGSKSTFSKGPLPSDEAEVNGNLLKVLTWLALRTGESKYIDLAHRIGDTYCLGILPKNGGLPATKWDWEADRAKDSETSLEGKGLAIVEGLVQLYAHDMRNERARAEIYRPTMGHMFNVLLSHARTPGGKFYSRINSDGRGEFTVDKKRESAAWPRLLQAMFEFGQISGNTHYTEPAISVLKGVGSSVDPASVPASTGLGILSLATAIEAVDPDSIENETWTWIDAVAESITNRHGSVSTDLEEITAARFLTSYAVLKTGGTRLVPWSEDLSWGSSIEGDTLFVSMASPVKWKGKILIGRVHNSTLQNSSLLTTEPASRYPILQPNRYLVEVHGTNGSAIWSGSQILKGLGVSLSPDHTIYLKITNTGPPGRIGTKEDQKGSPQ